MPARQQARFVAYLCGAFPIAFIATNAVLMGSPRTFGTRILDGLIMGTVMAFVHGTLQLVRGREECVRLDPYGLTIVKAFGRHAFIPWNDVWNIETRTRWGIRSVWVRSRTHPVNLPQPMTARLLPNERFDADVARIMAWWHHRRTVWPPPPAIATAADAG